MDHFPPFWLLMKIGAISLNYGGGVVNDHAAIVEKDLNSGFPLYGRAPATEDVTKIQEPLRTIFDKRRRAISVSSRDHRVAPGG